MYQERPLNPDETHEISVFAADGLESLDIRSALAPAEIVGATDSYVHAVQEALAAGTSTLSDEACTFLSLQLGCVLGDQLVRAFDWEWCCIQESGNDLYAVAHKDRSLYVLPIYFVRDYLAQPYMDCTAMLAFNMLAAQRFSGELPGGYYNVLDHVVRIVPRG